MTEKEMNFKTCKQVIMGMWDNPEGVAVDEVDINRMLFSFKDKRRGLQVLRGGPWCIKGFLLNLKLWSNSKTIHEVKHDHMEFWVQAHGVSLEHLNRDVAKLIRNEMENLIEVEDAKVNNVIVRSFLRMTVAVNMMMNMAEKKVARENQSMSSELGEQTDLIGSRVGTHIGLYQQVKGRKHATVREVAIEMAEGSREKGDKIPENKNLEAANSEEKDLEVDRIVRGMNLKVINLEANIKMG
ncbi:hypothetical protein Ahy_A04g021225 [Arachis hypogaea]|uniref:DUF4283 domain-containing protein n=1 Tax=Arachis hypogaea TaxID=3818 RepID=A0A445DJR1_ARAHY|nr:hypothetical protein Ahy_A04g021225 [Arachis hypogaea]